MINPKFLLGYPAEFKQLCLVYPPKVKDVVCNTKYSVYSKMLTFSQEEIEDEFVQAGLELKEVLTPFEYLLNNAYHHPAFKKVIEESFYFFIHEPVYLLPEQKQIVIGDISKLNENDQLRILKEEDFFEFQNFIREANGMPAVEPPRPDESPRIKAMKAKARYRDKIKAKQGKGLNLSAIIASISCMNMGLNPLNIGELSYVAVSALLTTYQNKEKYEIDIQSLLAGAKPSKVKPKYWIRNFDE